MRVGGRRERRVGGEKGGLGQKIKKKKESSEKNFAVAEAVQIM